MADLIKDFYAKVADSPEIVDLVQHYFDENAHSTVVAKLRNRSQR